MPFYPEDDGVTHINIFSKAKTELGRWMTNFARQKVVCPRHGEFESIEGFWYWLKTGKQHDILRELSGADAKNEGKRYARVEMSEHEFNRQILLMINKKIRGNPEMRMKLANCTLPFTHYYVYNGVVKQAGYEWITEHWDRIRRRLQGEVAER